MTNKTFNISTKKMTHFDCRDIEDYIASKKRWSDFTKTTKVWDNQENRWTDYAPEIEWDTNEKY